MNKMHIQVERERIGNLLDSIKKGAVAIPTFQRDFVWSPKEIVEFYDSILRGWPIGSLLLWIPDTDHFKTLNDIEGVQVSCDNVDVQYVLDGRQRLTSLISVLTVEGNFAQKFFVDLDEMSVFYSPTSKLTPNIISITDAFDTFTLVDYLERLRAFDIPREKQKKYADRAKEINKIFASYEIGYIVVYGGNIDEAVQIFSRLNSKSTTISPDYMIQALSYTPDDEFLFARKITEIKDGLTQYNLQDIKRDIILKCAYNYTDKPFIDAKAESLYKLKDRLPSIMEEVETDVLTAARFLNEECGIIDAKLLPYTYQFVMSALYFRYNKHKRNTNHAELKRWFFYTTYASYFTNTSLGNIREDLEQFELFCKGEIATPIIYKNELPISALPFSASLNAVRNCAFALAVINNRNHNQNNKKLFLFYPSFVERRSIDRSIICCNAQERNEVRKILTKSMKWEIEYEYKYNISEELWTLVRKGDFAEFESRYACRLHDIERTFLHDIFPETSLI